MISNSLPKDGAAMSLFKTAAMAVLGTLCAGVQIANAELITGITTTNALVTFDSATPGATSAPITVTGLGNGESLLGIDRRPATRRLDWLCSASRLYVINPV